MLRRRRRFHLIGWLATCLAATPGVRGADSVTLRLDDDNVVQPDICAWIEGNAHPRPWVGKDDFLHGAPELIIKPSEHAQFITDLQTK